MLLASIPFHGIHAETFTAPDVVIGTTLALTGVAGSTCKPIADGAEAWFKKVNDAGGVKGHKIVNIVMDDAYSAATAASNVREMLRQKVVAVFSGCGSVQPPAILPILRRENIPYLFPWSFAPGLADNPDVFALVPSYPRELSAFVAETFRRHGAGSIYAIVQGIPGANEAVKAIQAVTANAGGTFLGVATVTPGQDYTPVVLKAKSLSPDYVLIIQGSSDAAKIVITMQAQSALPARFVLGNNAMATQAFLGGVLDPAVRGKVLAVSIPAPAADARARECIDAFERYAPGLVADAQSLTGCTNAQALATAVGDIDGEVTSRSLVQAIQSWAGKSIGTGLQPLTFSATDRQGVRSIYVVGIDGDRFVTRYTLGLDR